MNAITTPEASALTTVAPAQHDRGRSFKPLAERLIEKVEITDSCWVWKGAVNANGYGSMWNGEKAETASRLSYRLLVGEIGGNQFVCHHCDNPMCVKPSHLFLGTHQENMSDRNLKGRSAKLAGALNPMAKLTEQQARDIKLSSKPAADLMAMYGVSETVISNIRKGKTWKHL